MTALDKVKAFRKRYGKWYQKEVGFSELVMKTTEKKTAEPPEIEVAEASKKNGTKVAQNKKTSPAGGNRGTGFF